jgi:gamma-glutamylcyclotransferase (GGCT)/AIG2-like uncharacterized protein YtfP
MAAPTDWYAPLPLFVYGTLRPGLANHARFCFDATAARPATIAGRLYCMPDGYPAVTSDARGRVLGALLTFPDPAAALRRIDPLEGVDPSAGPGVAAERYERRVLLAVPLAGGPAEPAWAYVCHPDQVAAGRLVPGGDWVAADGRGE